MSSIIKCPVDFSMKFFDSIDSTNSEAKRQGEKTLLHKTAFISDFQTAGRGRLSRKFFSPKGTGLYLSLVYSPKSGVKNPGLYTIAAAVSVAISIEKITGKQTKIKWVNDIFLSTKKICGILTEGIFGSDKIGNEGKIASAVIGIGVNIVTEGLPEEIKSFAAGIFENEKEQSDFLAKNEKLFLNYKAIFSENNFENEDKSEISLFTKVLAYEIVKNLCALIDEMEEKSDAENSLENQNGGCPDEKAFSENAFSLSEKILAEYKKRSILDGKTVKINPIAGTEIENPAAYEAKVLGINEKGNLIVETAAENGKIEKKELFSGEVSIGSKELFS